MTTDDAPQPGPRIPPAGVIGRIGKLLVGALEWWFVYALVTHAASIVRAPPRTIGFWVVVVWGFWLVPRVFNLGLLRERAWGAHPFWLAVSGVLAVGLANHLATGSVWSPATAVATLAVAIGAHAYVGMCHLLSAAIGFPGCELRALAFLAARRRDATAAFAPCPGLWTRIDRWEMRWRART